MASFRGFPCCSCMAEWLPVYEADLLRRGQIKKTIDVYQLTGRAAASSGTHSKGGAFDIAQGTTTAIAAARAGGADATWRRRRSQGFDIDHTHGVLRGCPHNGPARYQITSRFSGVDFGKNGLANGGKDDGPRPLSKRTYREGIKYMKSKQAAKFKPQVWYVAVDALYAHVSPSPKAGYAKPKARVEYGRRMVITATKTVYGTLWGRTTPGRWFILSGGRASKTKPPKLTARPVGFVEVATWNLAAQNAEQNKHGGPWADRAPDAVRRIVSEKVDVALLQEAGSGQHLKTLDKALTGTGYVRDGNGGHWRHILRNTETTKWIASDLLTLPTKVDSDGNQVLVQILEVHGVRMGFCSFHFDVKATTAQKVKQAGDTLNVAGEWFAKRHVDNLNITYAGDTNDNTGQVVLAFKAAGYWRASAIAESSLNAGYKTNNGHSRKPLVIPPNKYPLDVTFVWNGNGEGSERVRVTDWHQVHDDRTSDHNFQSTIRGTYRVA